MYIYLQIKTMLSSSWTDDNFLFICTRFDSCRNLQQTLPEHILTPALSRPPARSLCSCCTPRCCSEHNFSSLLEEFIQSSFSEKKNYEFIPNKNTLLAIVITLLRTWVIGVGSFAVETVIQVPWVKISVLSRILPIPLPPVTIKSFKKYSYTLGPYCVQG